VEVAKVNLMESKAAQTLPVARLTRVHPGFDARQLLTMETELSHTPYTSGARCLQFYQAVLEAVRALPTVESAETINILPRTAACAMSFDLRAPNPAAWRCEWPVWIAVRLFQA
jgi:hypothetical protein